MKAYAGDKVSGPNGYSMVLVAVVQNFYDQGGFEKNSMLLL